MRKTIFTLLCSFCFISLIFALTGCNDTHAHNYIEEIVTPTCTEQGYTTHTCECGDSYVDSYITALGHNFSNYISDNNATCTKDCTEAALCNRNCGAIDTRKKENTKLEHLFINYISNNNATCENNGTKIAVCDRENCQEVNIVEIENSAIGHDYGDWVSLGNGFHEKICKNDSAHRYGQSCSGGKATCLNRAICSTCLGEYGNLRDDHSFSNLWSFNDLYHWKDATCGCNLKESYNEHVADINSGFCVSCDYPVSPTSNVVYRLSANNEYAELVKYQGDSTKINIASYYLDKPVKIICAEAFKESNIEHIIIPNTVEIISERAFYDCDSLITVVFESNSLLKRIGTESFYSCYYLKDFIIPNSVSTIDSYAFARCENLTEVIVPDSVSSIGFGAFERCLKLTKITVPFVGGTTDYRYNELNFATHFGYIFGGRYDNFLVLPPTLKEVEITNGISLSDEAFRDCTSIVSIQLSDTITSIGQYAFFGCSKLANVNIPEGVNSIQYMTFYGCTNLSTINFGGKMSKWQSMTQGTNWNYNSNIKKIICLDGIINL